MSRRHVTLADRLTHDAATRFARRGYWLTLREAAAEVGVTRRRMSQLVEELDLAAPQVGQGRTGARLIRGCCVDAARSRARCREVHDQQVSEIPAARAMHEASHESRDRVNPSPDRCDKMPHQSDTGA